MRAVFGVALFVLSGCSLEAGEPCEVVGDGFTRQDPCEHTCVEWAITCEDGTTTTPGVCSAGPCATDAGCPADFACMTVGFDSECLPVEVCEG